VTIEGGTVSGTLTVKGKGANNCGNLLFASGLSGGGDLGSTPLKGNLTVKWDATPAVASSVISVKSADVGNALGGNAFSAGYTIPGAKDSKVTGAFTGGHGGKDSVLVLETSEPEDQLGMLCGFPDAPDPGVASLTISGGMVDLGSPPSSITLWETPVWSLFNSPGGSESGNQAIENTGKANGAFGVVYWAEGKFLGIPFDITPGSVWSSSNRRVATILKGDKTSIDFVKTHIFSVAMEFTAGLGTTTMSAKFDGVTGSATLTIVKPVQITTTSLPDATVGVYYDQRLAATGGDPPYTWYVGLETLPSGLSLNPATGEITGYPTAAGSSTFNVEVVDSIPLQTDNYSSNLSINVDP